MLFTYVSFNTRFINFHQSIFHLKDEFPLRNSQDGLQCNKKWNIYLNELNLLDIRNIDDEKVLLSEPIIATAISSNHVKKFLNLLTSLSYICKRKWNHIVYVYDLGVE